MPVKKKTSFWKEWGWVIALGATALGVWLMGNQFVRDLWNGWGYEPEGIVAEIEESLALTKDARRIFRATRPTVNNDVTDFNQACPNFEKNSEQDFIVLGCYADGRIHVYEITHEGLKDGNKTTMGHELLHAVWARLDEKEREQVKVWLDEVYAANKEWFDEQLESYDEEARQEEIYTRAGTTVADLPAGLEEHYAGYFTNRAQVVEYYQNYRAPFELLVGEIEDLNTKIKAVRAETDAERERYRNGVADLNRRITKFNDCADTAGCFASEAQFERQRAALNAERDQLESNRQTLNAKIEANNARVEKAKALREDLGELTRAIDSRPEEVEDKI